MGLEEFVALRCNFPLKDGGICRKALLEGWATSCSHLFCPDHAREWFQADDRCPVCLDKRGAVRMAKVGAPKDDATKVHTLLVGRPPCDIQLAAATAMNFWLAQKFEEFSHEQQAEQDVTDKLRRLIGNGRKRLTEAEALNKSMLAGVQELRRQHREAEQQLVQGREEASGLQSRLTQVHRAYKDALSRAAGVTPRIGRSCKRSADGAKDDMDFQLHRGAPARGAAPPGLGRSLSRSPRRGATASSGLDAFR